MKLYTSQKKIWEARTSLSECAFEALFKGMSTQFGRRIVENCFENALGMVGWFEPPKSSFGYHKYSAILPRSRPNRESGSPCFPAKNREIGVKFMHRTRRFWKATWVCMFVVFF